MEIAWEDRGKIPHDAYYQPFGPERGFEFENLDFEMKHWWARVYAACVNTEILHTSSGSPDGGMIKIVVTKQEKEKLHG
jgi:hypothetical protein